MSYAWGTHGNGKAEHWLTLPVEKVTQAVIGIHFAQTEPNFLREFVARRPGALRVVGDTKGVFHPKVLIGIKGGQARAIVGSSNFTNGGFQGNTELNLVIEGDASVGPLKDIVEFIYQQWTHPRVFEPSMAWLDEYDHAHAGRPHPIPLSLEFTTRPQIQLTKLSDLNLDWENFFELIKQQERRLLSTGSIVHVFDHEDSSYLQEIERCQEILHQHPVFSDLSLDQRKFVAGFGSSSGYFGRMVGAGNFKHMVIERPEEIRRALDHIPLKGQPTDSQIIQYFDVALAIRGVSLGSATRMLVAKRPDRFLPLNNANSSKLRKLFGPVPSRGDRYVRLLHRIWEMPWCLAPEPIEVHQKRIWQARVAMLDAVLYEPV
ncbi:MAG TPA: phospholipase D-like domain-containing protein [Sphingomicrobium sp.]|nr:phospholipase D-like domain-containing protein [Sphingomicrobium sp.]